MLNDPSAPVVPTPLGALTVPPVTLNSSRTPGSTWSTTSLMSRFVAVTRSGVGAPATTDAGNAGSTLMSTRGRQIASMKASRAVRSPA